jgi:hypothetical protein
VKPSTAAMERTDAVAMSTGTCSVTAMVAATHRAGSGSAPVTISGPVAITRPIPVAGAVVAVSGSTIVTAVVAVIPRTGTDKYAAYKIARSVEAVWRAGIWVVAVISIGTNGSSANGSIYGAHTNADRDLSERIACGKKQSTQQCNIS